MNESSVFLFSGRRIMANRGKEIDNEILSQTLQVLLTSTPFLSNRCIFYFFCHWFSIKFLKRYLLCSFVYICDVLALNIRHKPFLTLLGNRSSYS